MSALTDKNRTISTKLRTGSKKALKLVAMVAIAVFLAEAMVMLLLANIESVPIKLEPLLDAALLTLLVCPAFYFWVYRPLERQIDEKIKAEATLRQSLTEQQRLNNELVQAQQLIIESEKLASLGLLTAGIAHEIRGPVSYVDANLKSLNGYCQDLFRLIKTYEKTHHLLGDKHALVSELESLRNEIDISYLQNDTSDLIAESLQGTGRVKNIIQNYKDFSRKSDDKWEHADIHEGIESTLSIVWNELKYKAEVIKNYSSLPTIECNPSQLNQVIMNLLVNAAHAIEERGTITLSTGTEGEEVWLSVQDTGCGMNAEQKSRIFEPFFTTKARGKGTGLGLAISIGIVEKHNGRVEVESTLGEGSQFKVTLPIKQPIKE